MKNELLHGWVFVGKVAGRDKRRRQSAHVNKVMVTVIVSTVRRENKKEILQSWRFNVREAEI